MPSDLRFALQGCLFEAGWGSDGSDPAFDATFGGVERCWLDDASWIDHCDNWLHGADDLLGHLVQALPWRQREVTMWDKRLPEPRLTCWWDGSETPVLPHPVLAEIRSALTGHYHRPFDTVGFNLYRDGHDSVAWHGDRERYRHEDPIVVIVSLGAARSFMVRPRGGGAPSRTFRAGHGDLLVMGGSCQHDWEHCVPKTAHVDGPRLSMMFRHNLAASDALPSGVQK